MAAAASSKAPPSITREELLEFRKHFDVYDQDGNGSITAAELTNILKTLNLYQNDQQVAALLAEVDKDGNGTIEFDEFTAILLNAKAGHHSKFGAVAEKSKHLIQVKGASGVHSFAQEEMAAFSTHLNQSLANDPDVKHLLPINPNNDDLCNKVRDGILLCKFINLAVSGTIDERAINKRKDKELTLFKINENQVLCIESAKSIGVSTVNLGAAELIDGPKHPHLVLGLVWQLVKIQLLNSINLKNHPELVRLLEPGEELSDLLKLPPEELLLRWFNYHLKRAGQKPIHNFGPDVADSTAYTYLLNQIAPNSCDLAALREPDTHKRADQVLRNAGKLDVQAFIKAADIVAGNRRLNLAFTAAIFNKCPGLEELTEEEIKKAGLMEDDVGDSREERAFRMWMNSLGINGLYLNNLFEDCKDGLALLKVMDRIQPGCVDWSKVEKNPNNKFKRVGNCNYAVVIGKQLKFSLVGIGGSDICDGNKKLVLALVWQMMRLHIVKFLAEVQAKRFGGQPVTDEMIVQWANELVASKGRSTKMASFKDPSLSNSHFLMDLLWSVESRIIDWDLVKPGATPEELLLNARYAISVARKLGCTIFLLPEDIVEVRPKMMMTFVAAIMAVAK